jgi:hypothetical protein
MVLHFRFKMRYGIANPIGNNSRYYLCIAKKYIAQDFLKRNMKNLLLIREGKNPRAIEN